VLAQWGGLLAGIALVALSFLIIPLALLPLVLALTIAVGLAGASLLLGGIAQLLTPTPKVTQGADGQDDPRKSYSFSGIQNTSRQGVPVPIVYGETIVGSVVISAGIDTVQVAA
jgi:predicted phage tail protein